MPFKRLSRAEYNSRREKGLCFNCNEKYSFGHKCAKLFQIILRDDESDGTEEELEAEWMEQPPDGEISLQALHGVRTTNSMKLRGTVNKRPISIFIDSGSTHSYLNVSSVGELHCSLETTLPWIITVANGERTISREKCSRFKWLTHGHEFEAEFRIILLGGCDVILGHDWMWNRDPITFYLEEKLYSGH